MSLSAGTRIGPYEITSPLGEGGMGVVYRAHDTKLGRDVAIKALPDAFANDADRLQRFQREAQVLASLNHPNIAQIYGLEESDKTRCIVMELVEGITLQERLRRGPIPLDEALPMASQIATALEAAHERGIIHRDLKPANIKLTQDGGVKVLDFGLARINEAASDPTNLSNSPTLMSAASTPGMIMGTVAYMSPEQAKGQEVNRTSDVWAFGCVLYEMLTGRAPFEGETVSEVFAGILKGDPDWNRLPLETPENIRRLLRRCLQKERRLRLQHIGDARIEIEEPQSPVAPQVVPRRRERLAWATALVVALLAVAMGIRDFGARPPAAREMRLEISTPPTPDSASIAISPDGQKIVCVATSEGQYKLWMRPLDSLSGRALVGTDGASFPFWSPDSQSVGFFAEGKLKRVDVDRGAVQILADAPSGRGGAWNQDSTIIFTPNSSQSPIFRVLATGGTVSAVTRTETTQETSHRFPQFLPDGHHFLYYVQGTPESHGVYVGDLDGSRARRLLDVDSAPVYESSGHLLFVRQGTLFAQEFDVSRLELKGNPFPVAEHIPTLSTAQGSAAVSASPRGPIIYRTASAGGRRQLLWVDRSGNEIGKAGDPLSAVAPSISRDGRRVALAQQGNDNFDIWLLDLGRNVLSRFTFDPALDINPIWSPDSRQIVFNSNRKGAYDLYRKPATAPGSEELLLASRQDKRALDWSPDGRFLLYADIDPKGGTEDIWALPVDGDRKPFPVVVTNFDEDLAQFSPDGKWIAYQSNESGRHEIYIQPFPGPGVQTQVSANGGAQVRWSGDGKELFYIAFDGRLMAVPISLASTAQAIEAGPSVPLFATRVGPVLPYPNNWQYDVSPDGQRFLMNTIIEEAPSPITLILNWRPKP
jgi:serine/threonine protein kinase/Tol biopolymer transport system component